MDSPGSLLETQFFRQIILEVCRSTTIGRPAGGSHESSSSRYFEKKNSLYLKVFLSRLRVFIIVIFLFSTSSSSRLLRSSLGESPRIENHLHSQHKTLCLSHSPFFPFQRAFLKVIPVVAVAQTKRLLAQSKKQRNSSGTRILMI